MYTPNYLEMNPIGGADFQCARWTRIGVNCDVLPVLCVEDVGPGNLISEGFVCGSAEVYTLLIMDT